MSRSFRKTYVFPICCCNSQKRWKQSYNRTFRRTSKSKLDNYLTNTCDDYVYEDLYKRTYADEWLSPSDGKWRIDFLSKDDYYNSHIFSIKGRTETYEQYVNYFKRKLLSK